MHDDDDTRLDSYHQSLVQDVLDKDTDDARRELASAYVGQLTDQIQELTEDQTSLGSDQQMTAIHCTGWTGWAAFLVLAGWCLVLIDAAIWFFGGTRFLHLD